MLLPGILFAMKLLAQVNIFKSGIATTYLFPVVGYSCICRIFGACPNLTTALPRFVTRDTTDACCIVVMTISFLIINFYHFIAVPIGKTCSKSLMRFNNCIFYMLFYFIADFE